MLTTIRERVKCHSIGVLCIDTIASRSTSVVCLFSINRPQNWVLRGRFVSVYRHINSSHVMFRFKRSSSSSSLPPPSSLRFSGVNSPQVHRSTALRVVPLERSIFARRANNSIVPPPDGCSHNKTHNSTLNCCLTSPCLALPCVARRPW